MKVLLLDYLKSDAASVFRELYDFAGVRPAFVPDLSQSHNEGGMPRHERLYRVLQACWKPIRKHIGIDALDATQAVRDRVRDWLTDASDRSTMPSEDRAYLKDLYREPNRRLDAWLDADLSHWT
jgi:hypothetical protein